MASETALDRRAGLILWADILFLDHHAVDLQRPGVFGRRSGSAHRAALKKRVNELFGERADEALPYLLHLAGVKLEGEPAERIGMLDGETLKRQILITIARYFERLAKNSPRWCFRGSALGGPLQPGGAGAAAAVTDRAPLMLLLVSRLEREHASWQIKLKAETDLPTVIPRSSSSPLWQRAKPAGG